MNMELKQLIFLTLIGLKSVFAYRSWNCPYRPVCGNDGITYNSMCDFHMARLHDGDIQILFDGRCDHYKIIYKPQNKSKLRSGQNLYIADFAALLDDGPLHGIVKQNTGSEATMVLKARNSIILDTFPNWDGQWLGWTSISKK